MQVASGFLKLLKEYLEFWKYLAFYPLSGATSLSVRGYFCFENLTLRKPILS